MEKTFSQLQDGDFIEVYSTKLEMWLLCEIVTNYGICHWDENVTHYGYELELVKEAMEDKILKSHPFLNDGRRLIITEEMPNKYWKYNNTAKVLYGGRERTEPEEFY